MSDLDALLDPDRVVYEDEEFVDVVLAEGRVVEKRFEECTFRGVSFSGTQFIDCRFLGCTFEQCDLANIRLPGCTLREPFFEECKLVGVDWAEAALLADVTWKACRLDHGGFVETLLTGCRMTRCSAVGAHLVGTRLKGADLRHTDFTDATFHETLLEKADLRHARGYALDPRANRITGLRCSLPEAAALLEGLGIDLDLG